MTDKNAGKAMGLDELAPGIWGYTVIKGDTIYLPFIEVEEKGQGKCQEYLESLEKQYEVVKVPNVLSSALEHILQKRGYKLTYESNEFQECVEVWVK